jgi:two-component system invasion response regulator UvrY
MKSLPAKAASKPLRVLLADDHTVLREGLKQILREEFAAIEFGDAHDGQETVNQLSQGWDVLVLDLNMPGKNGLEVIKEAKATAPSLPILVLTMMPEEQVAARVLKAGAAGFLNKQTAPEELVTAVRRVMEGGRYLTSRTAEKLVHQMEDHGSTALHQKLSDREFQVMQLLAEGKSLKDIAADLAISVKTVSTFRTRLLTKLKLQNNVELALYAMQHKLLRNNLDKESL